MKKLLIVSALVGMLACSSGILANTTVVGKKVCPHSSKVVWFKGSKAGLMCVNSGAVWKCVDKKHVKFICSGKGHMDCKKG